MAEKKRGRKKEKKEPPKLVSRQERKQRAQAHRVEVVSAMEREIGLQIPCLILVTPSPTAKGKPTLKLNFKEFKKAMRDWVETMVKKKPQEGDFIRKCAEIVWNRFNNKQGLYQAVQKAIHEKSKALKHERIKELEQQIGAHSGRYKAYSRLRQGRSCEVCFKEGRAKFEDECRECERGNMKPNFAAMSFGAFLKQPKREKAVERREGHASVKAQGTYDGHSSGDSKASRG